MLLSNSSGAPQFEVIPRDKTETVNRTIQFVCIATGVPTPHLMWYREGEMLNMSSRIDFQFNELESHATLSLNILNTMPSDSGLYSCVAGNRAGIAESSFQLTINCIQISHSSKIHFMSMLSFQCSSSKYHYICGTYCYISNHIHHKPMLC